MVMTASLLLMLVCTCSDSIEVEASIPRETANPPAENTSHCTAPEARQFDFWLGDWQVEWMDEEGNTRRGSNRVESTLDGCVIKENFDGNPGTPLRGMSLSVYNPEIGKWQQTWVDNHGNYMVFTGGFEEGKMRLSRELRKDGKKLLQRMTFFNIEDNQLDWDWEKSEDGGKTWTLVWRLHYTRRGS